MTCLEKADMRILKKTACRHQMHVFTWTCAGGRNKPPVLLPCDCGMWTWQEWRDRLEEMGMVGDDLGS